jgi:hypothetical protein
MKVRKCALVTMVCGLSVRMGKRFGWLTKSLGERSPLNILIKVFCFLLRCIVKIVILFGKRTDSGAKNYKGGSSVDAIFSVSLSLSLSLSLLPVDLL